LMRGAHACGRVMSVGPTTKDGDVAKGGMCNARVRPVSAPLTGGGRGGVRVWVGRGRHGKRSDGDGREWGSYGVGSVEEEDGAGACGAGGGNEGREAPVLSRQPVPDEGVMDGVLKVIQALNP
jgi:hypothetical protein